jgi:membrane-bound lytic murein transglycosylase B
MRAAVFSRLRKASGGVALLCLGLALSVPLPALVSLAPVSAQAAQPFDAWLEDLRAEAAGRGVSQEILDAALKDAAPIPRVIELDRNQPEFRLKFDQYLRNVINDRRINKGRRLMEQHGALLDEVAAQYGVQKRFIVALWGIETDFGGNTGGFPVIQALATLAHEGRRAEFFRRELLLALDILEQRHIRPEEMKGSWAGAMGQSQFMPSSFHAYAVDHDGDGDKDIWGSLPDLFGSIATYLSQSGWSNSLTWGREVVLPADFDREQLDEVTRTLPEWQALGVRVPGGGDLPSPVLAARIVPVTEKSGRARYFIAYANFDVLLKWNRSTYFAIAVGTLANALDGR